MGKTAAGKGRQQRAGGRQSVKSAAFSAAAQPQRKSKAAASTPSVADWDDLWLEAQQQRSEQRAVATAQAEQLVGRGQHAEARALLQPLLSAHPQSAALHELLCLCSVGLDAADEALSHIRTACQLDPHGSGDRWMYLGQLQHGTQALEAFRKGAEVYARQRDQVKGQTFSQQAAGTGDEQQAADMETSNGKEEEEEGEGEEEEEEEDGSDSSEAVVGARVAALSASLSCAYVSMAELYVTDCCDEAEAEAQCESLLAAACREWPGNAEAAYATANLRLLQSDDDGAGEWLDRTLVILKQSFDHIRQPALSLLASATHAGASPLSSAAAASYELRLNVAKLAYELGRHKQCAALLDELLDEDDAFIEVQHLAACAHVQCQHFATARQLASTALDMCAANTRHDRQAAEQLKPVVAALKQLSAQCEGKEDVAGVDEAEEEEEQDEEEVEDEEDGEQEQQGEGMDEEDGDEKGEAARSDGRGKAG